MAENEVPEAIAKLIETLQSGATRDKRKAAGELAAFGPEAAPAINALVYCLSDADAAVRIYAADALGKIGPAAASELVHALRNRNDEIRQAVVRALAALDPNIDVVLPALIECLRDVDTTVRMDASNALVNASGLAVRHLIAGLTDEDPTFRRACCVTLGRIGRPARSAIPAIVDAAQNGRLGAEAGEAIQAIQGHFLAVFVRFLRTTLIRSHITIVAVLCFAAFIVSMLWIVNKILDVSMAVVAVSLSWGVIGTCLGAALGYHTRWRRIGAIVGGIVLGLGAATSGALVGETFVKITEGVVRSFRGLEPKADEKESGKEEEKDERGLESPIPILKPP